MTPNEKNALCAERLGWKTIEQYADGTVMGSRRGIGRLAVPNFYAHYDNAAALLVLRAHEEGWFCTMALRKWPDVGDEYSCLFQKKQTEIEAGAPTLPAAIVEAFLKLPHEAKV
jgi:hypothetical protein